MTDSNRFFPSRAAANNYSFHLFLSPTLEYKKGKSQPRQNNRTIDRKNNYRGFYRSIVKGDFCSFLFRGKTVGILLDYFDGLSILPLNRLRKNDLSVLRDIQHDYFDGLSRVLFIKLLLTFFFLFLCLTLFVFCPNVFFLC